MGRTLYCEKLRSVMPHLEKLRIICLIFLVQKIARLPDLVPSYSGQPDERVSHVSVEQGRMSCRLASNLLNRATLPPYLIYSGVAGCRRCDFPHTPSLY